MKIPGSYFSQILLMLFTGIFIISPVFSQKNRYGMGLTENAGNYTLSNQTDICPIIDCNSLPADAYIPYVYQEERVSPKDFLYCKTLSYVFKSYPTYDLKLEIDLPTLTEGPYPFIIYVHGGAWFNGDINSFKDQSTYLASRGIAGVRITYSLVNQGGHFDLGIQELGEAFDFIQSKAAALHLDMSRFGYAGGSAGTPLASLKAMTQNGCKLYIGCNGIYDFRHNLEGSFPGSGNNYLINYPEISGRNAISAINHIPDSDIPAVVFFHGTGDYTISSKQSRAFADSLMNKGGIVRPFIYDYYMHGFWNKGNTDKYEEIVLQMYDFAKEIFKTPEVVVPELSHLVYENFSSIPESQYNSFNNTKVVNPDAYTNLSGWVMTDNIYWSKTATYGMALELRADVENDATVTTPELDLSRLFSISFKSKKINSTTTDDFLEVFLDDTRIYSIGKTTTTLTDRVINGLTGTAHSRMKFVARKSSSNRVAIDEIKIAYTDSNPNAVPETVSFHEKYPIVSISGSHIQITTETPGIAQLFDFTGKVLRKEKMSGNTLKINIDKKGCYIISVDGKAKKIMIL
jgi:acetyl esterase/lipase